MKKQNIDAMAFCLFYKLLTKQSNILFAIPFKILKKEIMPKRKTPIANPHKTDMQKNDITQQIKAAAGNLYYMSETDAEILLFVGKQAKAVTIEELRNQTETAPDFLIEEKNFSEFFAPLTTMQDWFGDEEKAAAEKFTDLKNLLEANLRNLSAFKIGKIQIDIYVVGLDARNNLIGIQTKAVET